MARNDPQVIVRLPVELKDWVKAQSQKNHRSQNSEIVHILKSVQTSLKEAA
ncbi:Arc-like DNA binding domain protein [compost metagenome]